MGKTEI
jgi:hypothetical protein